MTKIERFKNTIFWIFRWAIYPIVLLTFLSLVQLYNQVFLAGLVWWRAIPIWAFTSIFSTLGVVGSGFICPNRKVGNFLFLGIFLVFEIPDFVNEIQILTALTMTLRLWADLTIITGFILAATLKPDSQK